MSTILEISSSLSVTEVDNSSENVYPQRMNEKTFFSRFTEQNSKFIGTDENESSIDGSITSFDIGDCITILASEKENSQIKRIIGWHISQDKSLESIKEDFDIYASRDKSYDLFIIGGNASTTNGKGCLLEKINEAIDGFFNDDIINIYDDLVNLNAQTGFTYVSANLQIDGTLSYCQH